MLASITPLGERGRRNRYTLTASWFTLGGLVGGALAGTLLAGIGVAIASFTADPADWAIAATVAVLALAALALEVSGVRVPSVRRQVDERWLDRYRGWVYGVGYGLQLGLGAVTVVNSAATHLSLACCTIAGAASGSVVPGLVIGLVFGGARGMSIWAARGIADPIALGTFHRRLQHLAPQARVASGATIAAISLGAVVAAFAA